ncbi:MAG: HAD family hydrolase [Candidatus Hermodarchaeota archaeon]
MIQAITFDLWNTLINNKSYSIQRFEIFFQFLKEREIFLSIDELRDAYEKRFHFTEVSFEEIEFRHIYTQERILNVLGKLNIEISKEDLEILKDDFESLMLQDPPSLKKGVKKTLEEIAPIYQIGLISNTGVTPGCIISRVLDEHEILDLFDVTIFSDETGYFKPHPIMFEIPLQKLNCKGENAIHIGDMLETDIKGANEFQMYSVWFNELNNPKSFEIIPDFEIKEISEVIHIIRDLS